MEGLGGSGDRGWAPPCVTRPPRCHQMHVHSCSARSARACPPRALPQHVHAHPCTSIPALLMCRAHTQPLHTSSCLAQPCTHAYLSLMHLWPACTFLPLHLCALYLCSATQSHCTHTSTPVPPDPKPCSCTPYPCTHPTHALIHARYPCRHPTHAQPCRFLPQISANPCPPPHPSVRLPPPRAQCRAPFSSCFIFVSQLLSPLPAAAPVPPSPHSLAVVITALHTSLLPASAQPPAPLRAPLLFTSPPIPSIPSFLFSPSLPCPTPPRSSLHAARPVPSPPCPLSPPHPRLTPLLQPSKFPPELGCGRRGRLCLAPSPATLRCHSERSRLMNFTLLPTLKYIK